MGAQIVDRVPVFTYTVEVQEFETKIWATGKKPENAPDDSGILQNTYMIKLARHDEPEIEITGHYWEIIEFAKVGSARMIA